MQYPQVIGEMKTLERLVAGDSIARFGDGEFKLTRNSGCVSQKADIGLMGELRAILMLKTRALVGIPNILSETPKRNFWNNYTREAITSMLSEEKQYYSSFITRPDSAPWIDTPEYWELFQKLWKGKKVTLVRGSDKSLMPEDLLNAAVFDFVVPERDAYSNINEIEEQISTDIVLMCCGATATVLAERLARKGKHALDVGHIGMFINNRGIYKMDLNHLISKEYVAQNKELHQSPAGFGGSGHKSAAEVIDFAASIGAESILDYGCGAGTLKKKLKELGWAKFIGEYDPAVEGKNILPKPAELVVCTDVLEHVEPEKVEAVLAHLYGLTTNGCYLNIAMRPANKILPDGRNAHLIIEKEDYWLDLVKKQGWEVVQQAAHYSKGNPHSLQIWLKK